MCVYKVPARKSGLCSYLRVQGDRRPALQKRRTNRVFRAGVVTRIADHPVRTSSRRVVDGYCCER